MCSYIVILENMFYVCLLSHKLCIGSGGSIESLCTYVIEYVGLVGVENAAYTV